MKDINVITSESNLLFCHNVFPFTQALPATMYTSSHHEKRYGRKMVNVGWSEAGINRFNKIHSDVIEDRAARGVTFFDTLKQVIHRRIAAKLAAKQSASTNQKNKKAKKVRPVPCSDLDIIPAPSQQPFLTYPQPQHPQNWPQQPPAHQLQQQVHLPPQEYAQQPPYQQNSRMPQGMPYNAQYEAQAPSRASF